MPRLGLKGYWGHRWRWGDPPEAGEEERGGAWARCWTPALTSHAPPPCPALAPGTSTILRALWACWCRLAAGWTGAPRSQHLGAPGS